MAAGNTTKLEELTKLATDFVTTQKGLWDHDAWVDFMSRVRAKGFDISDDMQANLGEMLEAMKQLYTATAATGSVENALKTIVTDSVTFVKRHQGVWGHPEWEDFVKTVERNTLSLSEGTMTYLGGILESLKTFYALSPVSRIQKRPPAARTKEKEKTPPTASPKTPDAVETTKITETKPAQTKAKAPQEPKKAAAKPTPATPTAPPKAPATPAKPDDLTAIGGIGPALAKKLNGAGINSYAQIVALSEEDIARLEKDIIRFTGRIKRDDWVSQAKKLLQGR
ncbi:MAG: hypothetical protein LGR52_15370 [Candidatus Thiosymbion ectosymbiont of Robbea hypermnestra]|nr:hypothetical protein [Candidatus Thiosymbion ectosymbiont of Robbea hypermnestra]